MKNFTEGSIMVFDFFLEAWHYCIENKIDTKYIKKISFRQWAIKYS